jgi:nicotinate-nucleotide adenylyltransferase
MTVNRLIGLLGGTFDPVHYGHLQPARLAKQQLGFDELRLLPCHQPVHRHPPVASPQQRVAMLKLALQEFAELSLDTRELDRDGLSYSFDTLSALRAELPHATFCWMLGFDAFQEFHQWYRWRQVLNLTHLLVVRRPGYKTDLSAELADLLSRRQVNDSQVLRQSPAGAIVILELNAPDISASGLRVRLANSESIDGLVPGPVRDWLNKNPVYSTVKSRELCK